MSPDFESTIVCYLVLFKVINFLSTIAPKNKLTYDDERKQFRRN